MTPKMTNLQDMFLLSLEKRKAMPIKNIIPMEACILVNRHYRNYMISNNIPVNLAFLEQALIDPIS